MADLVVEAKSYGIDPLTIGVLKQYLGDGSIIDAEIEIDGDRLIIKPTEGTGFSGLVKWIGKLYPALAKIETISTEAFNKIKQEKGI